MYVVGILLFPHLRECRLKKKNNKKVRKKYISDEYKLPDCAKAYYLQSIFVDDEDCMNQHGVK